MVGSKNEAKRDWRRSRRSYGFRQNVKFSLRMNKKMLNRRIRRLRLEDVGSRANYKRYAGEAAFTHID